MVDPKLRRDDATDEGIAALMKAALEATLDGFKCELLKHLPLFEKNDHTLLEFAVMNRAHGLDIVKFLLSTGLFEGLSSMKFALYVRNIEAAEDICAGLSVVNLLENAIIMRDLRLAQVVYKHNPKLIAGLGGQHDIKYAIINCGLGLVKWLINLDLVKANSILECDPLHLCALNAKHGADIARYFIREYNCDVNKPQKRGTPLLLALTEENIAMAKMLVYEHGDKLDLGENILNALHVCVASNKISSAKFLLETKEVKQMIAKDEEKTLQIAIRKSGQKMFEALLNAGLNCPDPNGDWNPLCHVGYNYQYGTKLARYFVGLQYELNERDKSHSYPLEVAFNMKNYKVAEELIQLGARWPRPWVPTTPILFSMIQSDRLMLVRGFKFEKMDEMMKETIDGLNALQTAARYAGLEMCNWLTNCGVLNPYSLTLNRMNLVHLAVHNDRAMELLTFFVSHVGLDVNWRDSRWKTPLHYALELGKLDVAERLIELNADFKVKIDKLNLLHWCALRDDLEGAKLVLQYDMEQLNEYAFEKTNALHFAASNASLAFCTMLVEKGIEMDVANHLDYTAVDWIRSNDKDLMAYLSLLPFAV